MKKLLYCITLFIISFVLIQCNNAGQEKKGLSEMEKQELTDSIEKLYKEYGVPNAKQLAEEYVEEYEKIKALYGDSVFYFDGINIGFNSLAKDTIRKTMISTQSEITCPKCNYKKVEILPTEFCLLKYTCDSCKITLNPKKGDCCVFCSYGTHKCPSMQEE